VAPRLGKDGKILAADIDFAGPVPVAEPLPELAAMLNMSDGDLLATMHRLNLLEPIVDLRADTASYLTRMSRLGVGTAEFEAELERLLDQNERRGLLGIVRRTQERYTTSMAVDGDSNKELIRISEGDTHVCDVCAELEGATGTYAEHEAIGLPGAQSCLGGDYCRCQLMPIGK
jgi:hypothetical protein